MYFILIATTCLQLLGCEAEVLDAGLTQEDCQVILDFNGNDGRLACITEVDY